MIYAGKVELVTLAKSFKGSLVKSFVELLEEVLEAFFAEVLEESCVELL